MLIRVILKDGQEEYVVPQVLVSLLEAGKVMTFKRADNWVVVGRDPIREKEGASHKGPERRAPLTGLH